MLRRLVSAAVIVGTVMTLAGGLAPLLPPADIANQFRPYTLAGSGLLLATALAMRMPVAVRWGAILTVVNAALLPLPLLWSAETTASRVLAQALAAPGHRDIKIVTFNIFVSNEQDQKVARFVLDEDPDIILLQEVTERSIAALAPRLATRYPHSHVCLGRRLCRSAIFAKRPWVSVEHVHRGEETPETISAIFDDGELGAGSISTRCMWRCHSGRGKPGTWIG